MLLYSVATTLSLALVAWLMTAMSTSPEIGSIAVNTWGYPPATDAAWAALEAGGSAMDAVEVGCSVAEKDLNYTTVGYGGSPDERGNTTLDAMIMDGDSMEVGAVASMERVKNAIRVARAVLNFTRHTMLVGSAATDFAQEMGFPLTTLETPDSLRQWQKWREGKCQPNFRRNVTPDPSGSCGPYRPARTSARIVNSPRNPGTVDENHHDTIGMIAREKRGSLAVGTSTNAAARRVPGRVGDSAVVGAGGYADSRVGAASATGDGDIMMRFLLSYQAVQLMRAGMEPTKACQMSLATVKQKGKWYGGMVALNAKGEVGAACVGFVGYGISVKRSRKPTEVVQITCTGV